MAQDPIVRISQSAHDALKRYALDNRVKLYVAAEKAVWNLVGSADQSARIAIPGVQPVQDRFPALPLAPRLAEREETIWGPLSRTDPDGTRWIATPDAGEVEEHVLQLIPEGDIVWPPSVATARALAASASRDAEEDWRNLRLSGGSDQAAPAPAPAPAPSVTSGGEYDLDEEED